MVGKNPTESSESLLVRSTDCSAWQATRGRCCTIRGRGWVTILRVRWLSGGEGSGCSVCLVRGGSGAGERGDAAASPSTSEPQQEVTASTGFPEQYQPLIDELAGKGAGLIPAQRCWSLPRRSASSRRAWRRTGTAAGPGG